MHTTEPIQHTTITCTHTYSYIQTYIIIIIQVVYLQTYIHTVGTNITTVTYNYTQQKINNTVKQIQP